MKRCAAYLSITETYWSVSSLKQTKRAVPRSRKNSKVYVTCLSKVHIFNQLLFFADLSKNRLTEIPPEVCLFAPLESLNLYHNCIKCIPEAIINLQMLTYLDIRWATAHTTLSVLPFHKNCVQFYIKKCLFPFHYTDWAKMLTWEGFPLLPKLNSQSLDAHLYMHTMWHRKDITECNICMLFSM